MAKLKTGSIAGLYTATETGDVTGGGTGGGVTTYATLAELPSSADEGAMAFVVENYNMYIWKSPTWWFVTTVTNEAPTFNTGLDASYSLSTDGTPLTLTVEAVDPEALTISYVYAVDPPDQTQATIVNNNDGTFTLTPSTTEADAGSFTFQAIADDGQHQATVSTTVDLTFVIPWSITGSTKAVFTFNSTYREDIAFASDTTSGYQATSGYGSNAHQGVTSTTHGYQSTNGSGYKLGLASDATVGVQHCTFTNGAYNSGPSGATEGNYGFSLAGNGLGLPSFSAHNGHKNDKFPFASDAESVGAGTLPNTVQYAAGLSGPDKGYAIAGSYYNGNTFPYTSYSQSLNYASHASSSGGVGNARAGSSGISNSDYGYSVGGVNSGTYYSYVYKLTFASGSWANGTSYPGNGRYRAGSSQSVDNGYIFNGWNGSSHNAIYKISFASDTNWSSPGSLSAEGYGGPSHQI